MPSYDFNTFGNVVNEAYNELSINSATITVPGLELTQMEKWANRYSKVFLEKVKLKSSESTLSFRTIIDTELNTDSSIGDTVISLTSTITETNASTSGMVIIDNSSAYGYSDYATTTMTLTDTLQRDYSSGDSVVFAYAMPTNFGKPRDLFINGSRYSLLKWGSKEIVSANTYSILFDVAGETFYIVLPAGTSTPQDATIHFYKKASNTLTTTDSMEIYQMWDSYVIYQLAARGHRLLYDTAKANEYEALSRDVLKMARQQIAEEDLSVNRGFSPGW